jgi:hypothetical protein
MSRYCQPYNKKEDEIILTHMRDVNKRVHRLVLKRCLWISNNYLRDRTPEGIRERWFVLIGKKMYLPYWENDIKDVADLLTPELRKRLRLRQPTMVPTGRRMTR